MRPLSRREVMALGLAGFAIPRPLWSSTGTPQRKFMFIFCPGGWDQVQVFAPIYADGVDREFDSEAAEVNGISFVDAPTRPSVRSFFETWGTQTALVNGIQVRSIAHEICRRLILTGTSQPNQDCWPSVVAANATGDLPMPNVHVSGPLFPYRYPSATVRVGSNGQLINLLDGTAVTMATPPIEPTAAEIEALEDAFVSARIEALAATTARNRAVALAGEERTALARLQRLSELSEELDLAIGTTLAESAALVAEAMQRGLSRAGVIACEGYLDMGWDSHSSNFFQDAHFETLFDGLNGVMADLAARPGEVEATLLEETTIVVLSEMGRVPSLNSTQGKEHWTWTSAMLIGAGVKGGQTIGSWTDSITGNPVDLASGAYAESGETLLPSHLGATLLTLAGVDPGDEGIDDAPIAAAIA